MLDFINPDHLADTSAPNAGATVPGFDYYAAPTRIAAAVLTPAKSPRSAELAALDLMYGYWSKD